MAGDDGNTGDRGCCFANITFNDDGLIDLTMTLTSLFDKCMSQQWPVGVSTVKPLLPISQRHGHSNSGINWNKSNVSDDFLLKLKNRCPSLRKLYLSFSRLESINIASLPTSLHILSITNSLIPSDWFRPLLTDEQILPRLTELDLSDSTKTSNTDIEAIATARPHLSSLYLNGCYRITTDGFKTIAERLPQLTMLEIGGTRCDDLAFHHIGRGLPKLQRLSVAGCRAFGDGCLGTVVSTLCNLKTLNLRGCQSITDAGFASLSRLSTTLRLLDISDTAVGAETLDLLKAEMPLCKIV